MMIDYVGTERCDILYYIVKIGKNLKKNILVIDNSITGDLFHLYKDENNTEGEEGSVRILRNRVVGKDEAAAYDTVIVYEGLYPEYTNYRDLTIFAPNENEAEWEMMKPFVENRKDNGDIICILRDRATKKVNSKVVSQYFGIELDEVLEEEYGDNGYVAYVALMQNHMGNIPKRCAASAIALNIASLIYHVNAKELKKTMKL